MIRRLLATVALCTLTACVSAPVYHRADTAAVSRPAATAAFQNANNAAFAANDVPGNGGNCMTIPG